MFLGWCSRGRSCVIITYSSTTSSPSQSVIEHYEEWVFLGGVPGGGAVYVEDVYICRGETQRRERLGSMVSHKLN